MKLLDYIPTIGKEADTDTMRHKHGEAFYRAFDKEFALEPLP